jgi:probable lipoprotein NlpC
VDASSYIGIPFVSHGLDRAGCDCWGLARMVLLDQHGIVMPAFDGSYTDATLDPAGAATEVVAQQVNFVRVPAGEEQACDLVLLPIGGLPCHIGIVVRPPWMLHTESRAIAAALERYDTPLWSVRARRGGFWRHRLIREREARPDFGRRS